MTDIKCENLLIEDKGTVLSFGKAKPLISELQYSVPLRNGSGFQVKCIF